MSTIVFYARERWFEMGVMFFAIGVLVAGVATALAWLPQLRVLAAIALVQALLGLALCAWGLHEARPARWMQWRMRARALFHRARQSVRRPAYAR